MAKNKKNKTDKDKGKPELVGKRGYRKPEEIGLHDELRGLYLITGSDQKLLTDGIRSDGFLEDRPLMLFKGPWTNGKEVLGDGHTRLQGAISNGIKKIPVVVHETETLQDAVSMIFGVDYRQRKRYETVHLIHLLKKIQPMVASISDAGKKPKGKMSVLLGRWIGASQATVERMQSILKNPEAMAYIGKHKKEKLSILNIYDMFKDKAEGGDGPSAPRGKGQETPPVPPVSPAGEGENVPKCRMFGRYDETCISDCGEMALCKAKMEADNAQSPEERSVKPDCYGEYNTEDGPCNDGTCMNKRGCLAQTLVAILLSKEQCKSEIADAEARGDVEEVKKLQTCLEDYETAIEATFTEEEFEQAKLDVLEFFGKDDAVVEPTPPVEVASPNGSDESPAVNAPSLPDLKVVPPKDSEEATSEEEKEGARVWVPEELAAFFIKLPMWLFKFINGNIEDFKRCRWIAIGEGSVPTIDDSEAMIETNPDNPPLSKAQEKKAAKAKKSKTVNTDAKAAFVIPDGGWTNWENTFTATDKLGAYAKGNKAMFMLLRSDGSTMTLAGPERAKLTSRGFDDRIKVFCANKEAMKDITAIFQVIDGVVSTKYDVSNTQTSWNDASIATLQQKAQAATA